MATELWPYTSQTGTNLGVSFRIYSLLHVEGRYMKLFGQWISLSSLVIAPPFLKVWLRFKFTFCAVNVPANFSIGFIHRSHIITLRNEYKGLQIPLGWRGLGPTQPRYDVTCRSGTDQASRTLSSLSCQAETVELAW